MFQFPLFLFGGKSLTSDGHTFFQTDVWEFYWCSRPRTVWEIGSVIFSIQENVLDRGNRFCQLLALCVSMCYTLPELVASSTIISIFVVCMFTFQHMLVSEATSSREYAVFLISLSVTFKFQIGILWWRSILYWTLIEIFWQFDSLNWW